MGNSGNPGHESLGAVEKRCHLGQPFCPAIQHIEFGQSKVVALLLKDGIGIEVQVPPWVASGTATEVKATKLSVNITGSFMSNPHWNSSSFLENAACSSAVLSLPLTGLTCQRQLIGIHRFNKTFVSKDPKFLFRGSHRR